MENFMKNCYCWIRQKDNSQKKISKEVVLNNTLKIYLTCAGCYSHIDSMLKFVKIAKIGYKTYGFCSITCYEEWLANPAYMHLSPIQPHNTIPESLLQ